MIDEKLLAILRCPESRQPLQLADSEVISKLNVEIEKQALKYRTGIIIKEPLQAGLIREDGHILYAIRDDIPVLLIEEGIELS